MVAAKDEARRNGFEFKVGFAATPSFNPADDFWADLASRSTPAFRQSLDYVGLDFYPDVFRPVPEGQLPAAVEGVLTHFRWVNLVAAGIRTAVPVRVTENGWPTGPGRSADRQAQVLEAVVRQVHQLRTKLNITHYEFFLLRDGDSGRPDMGAQFGLLRHDYALKPAFDVYRRLIAELGGDKWPARASHGFAISLFDRRARKSRPLVTVATTEGSDQHPADRRSPLIDERFGVYISEQNRRVR